MANLGLWMGNIPLTESVTTATNWISAWCGVLPSDIILRRRENGSHQFAIANFETEDERNAVLFSELRWRDGQFALLRRALFINGSPCTVHVRNLDFAVVTWGFGEGRMGYTASRENTCGRAEWFACTCVCGCKLFRVLWLVCGHLNGLRGEGR